MPGGLEAIDVFQETLLVKRNLKVLFRSACTYILASFLEDKHLLPHELLTLPSSSQISNKMRLRDVQCLELPPSADMHVHLRQDQVNLHRLQYWIRLK